MPDADQPRIVTPRDLEQMADDIAEGRFDHDENPQVTLKRLASILRDYMRSQRKLREQGRG